MMMGSVKFNDMIWYIC